MYPTAEDCAVFKQEMDDRPLGQWSQRRCSACGLWMVFHGPFETPWDCASATEKHKALLETMKGQNGSDIGHGSL